MSVAHASSPASRSPSSRWVPPALRPWQTRALGALEGWTDGPFLISAAPGAGKTRPALELARTLLRAGTVRSVLVACPTTPLTRQWAAAAGRLGLDLLPDAPAARVPADFDGVAVTYARLASAPRRWARQVGPDTLVIADETHHLGQELAWGEAFATAMAAARRWLLLSGTPFRSDAAPIPGVSYDSDGVAEPDVAYSYAEAVGDGVCRPVTFVTYDGALSWRSGDEEIESSFHAVLTAREAGRRYRTAISPELPDGLPRILREAHGQLGSLRAGPHPDAGGLVVAADSVHARQLATLLREVTGRPPVVVLHTESRAAERLAGFSGSRDPWIVAVNMVSEGVDIPRLRVGVYATAAKTPLVFRQIVGRFVRTLPGRAPEPSWLYLPADPVLRRHAAEIETELAPLRRRREEEDVLGFDEDEGPVEVERRAPVEFVPLAADVAPQMALFGGGARVAAAAIATPGLTHAGPRSSEAAPAETPPEPSAFERRARLRDQRRRLVADLSRRDRRSHREINAWVNNRVGVGRVNDATIQQLERSVEVLLRRLTGRP